MGKLIQYLQTDIWRLQLKKLPRRQMLWVKPIRSFLLAFRGFAEDQCQLRASALTFYSLLSVVPIVAMAFGVAKGFGLDTHLEATLTEKMADHQEVVQWIIQFAQSFLENTKGGLIAGVGVAVLLWTVIKMLGDIENSFNGIWGIKEGRTLLRKFSDYISIMLICPVLLIMSSSLTVFVTSQVQLITEKIALLGHISGLIHFALGLLPYMVVWVVFIFMYKFMPNTKVDFKAALFAGIVGGTLFQCVQWGYIHFQVGVSRANAIYGSFAALPLFLMWLQISWLVVLFGAEISFAMQNQETYEFEKDALGTSLSTKRLISLKIVQLCISRFLKSEAPLTTTEISETLETPIRLTRELLFDLKEAKVLSATLLDDEQTHAYLPATDPNKLTIGYVLNALDEAGTDTAHVVDDQQTKQLSKALGQLKQAVQAAPENKLLLDV